MNCDNTMLPSKFSNARTIVLIIGVITGFVALFLMFNFNLI